jgi:diguanylate cyclase (GGDEF)-like protein
MTLSDLLLLFALLTHAVIVGVWWAAGSQLSLSSKAAGHWMLAAMAHGAALILYLLDDRLHGSAHNILADALVVIGFVAMRRGLQWFMRKERTDSEHLITGAVLAALAAAVFVPLNWPGASAIVCAALVGWVCLRTSFESHALIHHEFGRMAPWVVVAPLGVVVLIMAARVGYVLLGLGQPVPLWSKNPIAQIVLILLFLFLAITLNFALGYVVVVRLVRKLQHLSQHDGLTGLLNRRAMEYLLDREAQRLQRFGQPYAVMLVDIDHFKRVNDQLGHAVGDAVLASVARTLNEQAREVDRVGRFGGEEFCVLLPHTQREGALLAAERFREAVRRDPVSWGDEVVSITISVGVAAASDPTETLEALLHRADQAMYRAKAQGRDRVILAPPVAVNGAAPAI